MGGGVSSPAWMSRSPSYRAPMLDQTIKFMISRDKQMLGGPGSSNERLSCPSLSFPSSPSPLPPRMWGGRLAEHLAFAWEFGSDSDSMATG